MAPNSRINNKHSDDINSRTVKSVASHNPNSKLFSVAEVESWLLLCGASVLSPKLLTELAVTCVISVAPELPPLPLPPTVHTFHRLCLKDSPTVNIRPYLGSVADIIHQVSEEGGRVLVHCVAGVSRSASLCLAYLIKYRAMSLAEAYSHVLSRRPCIRPNNGFFQQLIDFEKEVTGLTTVEMVYNQAANGIIPSVYETDYINTIRYISRTFGIK